MYAANLPRTSLSRNGVYYYRLRRKDFESRLSLETKEHHIAASLVYTLEAFRLSSEFQQLSNEHLIIRCNRLIAEQHQALRGCAVRAGVPQPPRAPLPINAFDLVHNAETGAFQPENIGPGEWLEAVEAASELNKRLTPTPRPALDPSTLRPPLAPPVPMDQLIQKYAVAVMGANQTGKRKRLADKTQSERRVMIANFLKTAAPKTNTPREVTRQSAQAYFEEDLSSLSSSRFNTIYIAIDSFFEYCVTHNQAFENPMTAITRRSKKDIAAEAVPTAAFTEDQLTAIFAHPDFKKDPKKQGYYWGPVLLFLTGARPNEIAQSRLDDYQQTAEGWYLKISDEFENQSVKTLGSQRTVPLHPVLSDLGFFDWLQTEKTARPPEEQLFPHLTHTKNGYAKNLSRQFNERFLPKLDFPKTSHTRSLKSFRHSFVKLLTERGAHPYILKPIVGHGSEMLPINTRSDAHEEYSKDYSYTAKMSVIQLLPVGCLNPLKVSKT